MFAPESGNYILFLLFTFFFSTLGNNSTLNGWKEDEHLLLSSLLVSTVHTPFSQSSGQSYSGEAYWVLTESWCPNCSWAVQCAVVTLPYLPIVLFFWKLSKLPLVFFFFFSFARLSTYSLLIQPRTLSYMGSLTCLASRCSTLWLLSSCLGLWLLAAVPCCGFGGVSLPAQELTCSVSFWIIQSLGLVPPHYSPISFSLFPSTLVKHVFHIRGPQHLGHGLVPVCGQLETGEASFL